MTLVIKDRDQHSVGSSGWQVVVEETGELILSTQFAVTRAEGEKDWTVYIPWPGFRKGIRAADQDDSLRVAEKVLARLLTRLHAEARR